MLENSQIILLIVIATAVAFKFVLWSGIKRKRKKIFFKSFYSWMNPSDFYSTTNPKVIRYIKINNPINFLIWFCLFLMAIIFMYDLN